MRNNDMTKITFPLYPFSRLNFSNDSPISRPAPMSLSGAEERGMGVVVSP